MPRPLNALLLLLVLPLSVCAQAPAAGPDLGSLPAPAALGEASEHELTADPLVLSLGGGATVKPVIRSIRGRYGRRAVPYLAPYDARISARGGPYWLACFNHSSKHWQTVSGALTGDETANIGLDPNAADATGAFHFALVGGPSPVEFQSISLRFPPPPPAGQPVNYQSNVHARDGTALATDIHLPFDQRGPLLPRPPFPVLLLRTPYDKRYLGGDYIGWVSKFNAVVVVQYFRGRPKPDGIWPSSGGVPSLFRDHAGPEHFDAVDTVNWLQARNFQNDELLLVGASALGMWIYQAATALPGQITATYAIASAGDVGRWAATCNGCYKESNVEGWVGSFGFPEKLAAQVRAEGPLSELWRQADFNSRAGQATSPGWHETGWWDVDVEQTIASWKALQERGGRGARGQQWLVVGPWVHEGIRYRTAGDLRFPYNEIEHNPSLLPLGWEGGLWSAWQLGHNPFYAPPDARVRAYFVGAQGNISAPSNTWYSLADWPPAHRDGVYHLTADGNLAEQTGKAGRLSFVADPANPVPTIGGANLPLGGMQAGPLDQSPLDRRSDILRFSSEPLAGRRSIAGPIRVKLHVETDARDTDVMVKLLDIYPDGRKLAIADAPMRLSWHAQQQGQRGVQPDKTYELEFEVGQRAYVFAPGHRIGLEVAGSNHPRFAVNPGTGAPNGSGGPAVVQRNTLHVGGQRASRLILPLYDPSL